MTKLKPCFEVNIFSQETKIQMLLAAILGNADATEIASIYREWGKQVMAAPSSAKPLCLTCDATNNDDPTWGFMLLRTFPICKDQCVVSGICPSCTSREDIVDIVKSKVLQMIGGGYVVNVGRA